jgi:hypothetical protein
MPERLRTNSCLHEQEVMMTQTFLGLAAVDVWSRLRMLFSQGHEAAADTSTSKEDVRQGEERSRLPEREESFYLCMYGHR